jgi:hypothetical protein
MGTVIIVTATIENAVMTAATGIIGITAIAAIATTEARTRIMAVDESRIGELVPAVGIEPTTNGLQNRCSTN